MSSVSLLVLNTRWCLPTTKTSLFLYEHIIFFFQQTTLPMLINNDALFLFLLLLSYRAIPMTTLPLSYKQMHTHLYKNYISINILLFGYLLLSELVLLLLLLLLGISFPRELKDLSNCFLEALKVVVNQAVLFKVVLAQETYQD